MNRILKLTLAASAVALSSAAQAQVAGTIATANPIVAIANAKALAAASQQIEATYKSNLDQMNAKAQQRQTFLVQLDKNKDKQVDDAELKAAERAKSPALTQANKLEQEMQQLLEPAQVAQLFAIESLLQRYDNAQNKVIADRRIGVIVSQDSLLYAPPAADITTLLTAELDRVVPTVGTTPPANWRPQQQTVQVAQQVAQVRRMAAMMQAAQAQRQQARPAAGVPAAQQPAQARPATAQPQGR